MNCQKHNKTFSFSTALGYYCSTCVAEAHLLTARCRATDPVSKSICSLPVTHDGEHVCHLEPTGSIPWKAVQPSPAQTEETK